MMKKTALLLLLVFILLVCLSSCRAEEVSAPSCDEVIAAYKDAGYHVSHYPNQSKDESTDEVCYVKVWLDDEYDSAYFNFYESAEVAEAIDAEREYNVVIYLFSVIYGDPSWLWTETYGNIQYEYEDPEMIKPFRELVK